MAIRDWQPLERPREKLLALGAEQLSDAELLAIFLRVGVKGKSAVDLASELLESFGDLNQLLNADETTFCQAKGLGEAKYVQLKAVLEMSRRHFEAGLKKGDAFTQPENVAHYLIHQIGFQSQEHFGVLFLDQQHRLIQFKTLFIGSLNQALVSPREIAKTALTLDSAAVVLAHNHPSGDPTPSQQDFEITRRITQALALLEIRCLDHVILGDLGRWHSFAQHQQMPSDQQA